MESKERVRCDNCGYSHDYEFKNVIWHLHQAETPTYICPACKQSVPAMLARATVDTVTYAKSIGQYNGGAFNGINTAGTYQQNALRTLSDKYHIGAINPDLMHAAIGLATESGELLDAIKKCVFYGKPLDVVNVKEELGDLLWYLAVACHATGTTIDEVGALNIAKLKARYPDRFTEAKANERDTDHEREVLQGHA